jgi:FAD:protein FMN transferase
MNGFLAIIFGLYTFGISLKTYVFEEYAMGVLFRITLYAESRESADFVARKAFERIKYLESCFSDYLPESELNQLPKLAIGEKKPLSSDLWNILAESKSLFDQSHGAFDVAIGRLTKIWRKSIHSGQFPDPIDLELAMQQSGFQNVSLDPLNQTIEFLKEGIEMDLGGIGKGYAAEAAGKILEQNGISHYLVDAGGDLYAGNFPEDPKGWKIMTEQQEVLFIKNQAIATSGNMYRSTHILDPRTGKGSIDNRLVTVWGEKGSIADALATILSILDETDIQLFMIKYYPAYQHKIYYPPLKEN